MLFYIYQNTDTLPLRDQYDKTQISFSLSYRENKNKNWFCERKENTVHLEQQTYFGL